MPEQTIAEKAAEIEFELRLFKDFINSPIWRTLKGQWQPLVDTAIGAALSGKVEDRGFAAGRANGLRSFMQYPEKHVKGLEVKLKQLRSGSETQTLQA